MHSAAHRGVTVVTITTLIFAPVFRNHHWVNVLVGRKQTTVKVQCATTRSCPAHAAKVVKVVKPVKPVKHRASRVK
jgi:hypothetical protein